MTTYATWNPSTCSVNITLSGGNLVATEGGVATTNSVIAQQFNTSGDFFCEITMGGTADTHNAVGLANTAFLAAYPTLTGSSGVARIGSDAAGNSYGYQASGYISYGNANIQSGLATYTTGDVIGIRFTTSTGSLTFYKNGVQVGTTITGVSLTYGWAPAATGYYTTTSSFTGNFGGSAWAYTPSGSPTGWILLNGTGTGASTMLPLFALGTGPNGGAVALQPMTAAATGMTVYNAGAPVMQTMSASGIGSFLPAGAATLQTMTAAAAGVQGTFATGDALALKPLTAAGTGIAVIKYVGAASLQPLTATGVGTSASVGTAAVVMETMTAEGHVASTAAVSLQQVTASAVGATGTIGAGAAQQQVLTANGAGVTPMLGSAAVTLQPLTASGVGATLGTGTGAALLQQIQVAAAGFGGTVGTAALQMALATAQATGYPVVTGSGQVVMPAMSADGRSTQAVVAAYNTWVMNTRNLDLTEYTNYNFDSYTEFMGLQLASGPAGITQLTGTDDAGTPIAAVFKTGNLHKHASQSTDERSSTKLLKIPEILMTVDTEAPLTVTVEKEDLSTYTYMTPYVGINTMVQVRVTPGKALRALDYRVEVANNNGAAFDCVELNVPLEETKRRLGDK